MKLYIGLAVALGLTGCHGYKAPAYATLSAMAGAAEATAGQIPPICEGRENAAVDNAKTRDEAMAKTAAIYAQCKTALTVLDGVGHGLKSARDAIHDAPAGADLSSAMPWIKLAVQQYCDAAPLLADFKVNLPTFDGVCP